eukprot:GHVP01052159.1.p1 GENE.GHVP01052159.1~~GHVP01052159.1.p1  ORF type:complete len:342 (+),score=48.02 GHVP01052159.1:785-1810(+)
MLQDYEEFMAANENEGNMLTSSLSSENLQSHFGKEIIPFRTFESIYPFNSVDASWADGSTSSTFITSSRNVELWDLARTSPVATYGWNDGCDKMSSISFNRSETHLAVGCGVDRSVLLYDTRSPTPLKKVILKAKSNSAKFNPQHPSRFTCACEDGTLHTFDLRQLEQARVVHMDFTHAVTDIDYHPNGEEFVASSFDKTIRIFNHTQGRSREVYHTRRMQEVHATVFSQDGKFVLSASNDMCVRLWKSDVAQPLGTPTPVEARAMRYRQALKERFKHEPEVRRLIRHRHVPSLVKKKTKRLREIEEVRRRKKENVKMHSKPEDEGTEKKSELRAVLGVVE